MKKHLMLFLLIFLVTCVLASCAVPAINIASATPFAEETQPVGSTTPVKVMPSATQQSPITPQYSEGISDDPIQQETDWSISYADPDFTACVLPQSIPEISEDDMQAFNPDKTVDYLAEGLEHQYYIQQAKLVDGTLYINVLDNLFTEDINYEYEYLKETFSLEDDIILDLPAFSGCVIHGGTMYASETAWQDRQQYESYED